MFHSDSMGVAKEYSKSKATANFRIRLNFFAFSFVLEQLLLALVTLS